MPLTVYELESKTFASGGNVQVSFRDAPPGRRIRAILLSLESVITQSGAAQAIVGTQLPRIFSAISIGSRYRMTGQLLKTLEWAMTGKENLHAGIAATNDGVFRRAIQAIVPFADPRSEAVTDACPITDFFRDTPLTVDFAAMTALGATVAAMTGTLRTTLLLDDPDPGVAPSISEIGFGDFAGQTVLLEPGLYSHLFAMRETGLSIDSAEVATYKLAADGRTVADLVRTYEAGALFNTQSHGSAYRADSATAPVSGERLTEGYGFASDPDPALPIEIEWLPLFVAPPRYKMTDLLLVESTLRLDYSGTDTSMRIAWRRFAPRSNEQAFKALAKNGVIAPDLTKVVAKTLSKTPLSPSKAPLSRFMPLRQLP